VRRIFVPSLMAVLFLSGCSSLERPVKAAIKPAANRKPAPDFTLKDSDGKAVKLSDFKGKVVLLNFWATWCGPCKIEIPWFVEFERNYKDKGLVVLGVSMDEEGWEAVKPFIGRHQINYRVLLGDDMTAAKYGGVDSLPTTFMVDKEGRTAAIHVGLVSKKDYVHDIETLLGVAAAGAGGAK